MDEFEKLLEGERPSVERFVRFRISSAADADDVLQEVYIAAYGKFSELKRRESFKGWLISIARNKCNDYFRRKGALQEVSLDLLGEKDLHKGRHGGAEMYAVRETVGFLGDRDREILYLYFWCEMSQAQIAKRLNIPIGTVKSRLHTAKRNFKRKYPYHTDKTYRTDTAKGENIMKKLPEILPEYSIKVLDSAPGSVKCEELIGMNVIPRLGERCVWGSYDMPSRRLADYTEARVVGKCEIHGIEGVEIEVEEHDLGDGSVKKSTFAAQLTDTHCRYLAREYETAEGVRRHLTFLDGEMFIPDWGFGEDNIGTPTNLSCRGIIKREGDALECDDAEESYDIVSRCELTFGTKVYDTVCLMDVRPDAKIVTEQYLDRDGRTVLWRRFNRDDWAIGRWGKRWCEMLPESQRLTVNGDTYVHWYDCVTDHIF